MCTIGAQPLGIKFFKTSLEKKEYDEKDKKSSVLKVIEQLDTYLMSFT